MKKFKKFLFKKVNSTNDIAIKRIKSGLSCGIIVSDLQTRGRGQYGRKWISQKGNLFMSIFFKIKKNLTIKKITTLNIRIIQSSLMKIIKKKVFIKYPNDFLLNKKKFCGILQEIYYCKGSKFLVIGIGINLVNNPKIISYPATNIYNETGLLIKKKYLIQNIENIYIKKQKLFA